MSEADGLQFFIIGSVKEAVKGSPLKSSTGAVDIDTYTDLVSPAIY